MLSLSPFRLSSRAGAPASTGWRQEVCPPSLQAPSAKVTMGWRRWLGLAPGARRGSAGRRCPLTEAREECAAALADIGTQHAEFLQHRLLRVRSLRELWYLRSEMFGLIALHRSESEAERRMAALNRHFPTRTAGSGFMPLNG